MAFLRGTSGDYKDLLTQLKAAVIGDHVTTITRTANGTGYVVGDLLTLLGGTTTHAAVLIVTSVGGSGEVTGARIYDAGAYTADPTLTGNIPTTGTGTLAAWTLTMEVSNWDTNLDDATLDTTSERVILFEETVQNVFVGIRTYQGATLPTPYNWILLGHSSFNAGLPWYQQPDAAPSGFSTVNGDVNTAGGGIYMPLKISDGTDMDYWFEITNRRIIVVTKMHNATITTPRYSTMYLGLLNAFGTSAEFPYPLFLAGSANDEELAWNDNTPAAGYTGLSQMIGITTSNVGPGFYYHNDGIWKSVQNSTISGLTATLRGQKNSYTIYPVGHPLTTAAPGVVTAADSPTLILQWENLVANNVDFALGPAITLMPTPDTASTDNEKRMLVPLTMILSTVAFQQITNDFELGGELDGCFWASAAGTTLATSEDTITDPVTGDIFHYFQNGTYTLFDGYTLIREELISD